MLIAAQWYNDPQTGIETVGVVCCYCASYSTDTWRFVPLELVMALSGKYNAIRLVCANVYLCFFLSNLGSHSFKVLPWCASVPSPFPLTLWARSQPEGFGFWWPPACALKTWWVSGTFLRYKGAASVRHLSGCHMPECQKKQVTLCFLVRPHFVTVLWLVLFWCLRVQQCVLTRNELDRKTEVQPWIQ